MRYEVDEPMGSEPPSMTQDETGMYIAQNEDAIYADLDWNCPNVNDLVDIEFDANLED